VFAGYTNGMVDIDPMAAVDSDDDGADAAAKKDAEAAARKSKLNSAVAITVALLATFMGICKVKDDNICQAMQQAQADKVDHWGWYQAHDTRQEVFATAAESLRLTRAGLVADSPLLAQYDKSIADADARAKAQTDKKAAARAQAEGDEKAYADANYRDDQFDLADAMIAIAISLLALTALTQKRWLYAGAIIPTAIGVLMGTSGLLGLHVHSDTLAAWLS
jgi:hypothetical protein